MQQQQPDDDRDPAVARAIAQSQTDLNRSRELRAELAALELKLRQRGNRLHPREKAPSGT